MNRWRVGRKRDGRIYNPSTVVLVADDETAVCQVYGIPSNVRLDEIVGEERWQEGLANARLIAASPELLEALKEAREYVARAYECAFPDERENQAVLARIDAVLARAEGR